MKPFNLQDRSLEFSRHSLYFVQTLSITTASSVGIRQFVRSATSIGANSAEAQGGATKKDFLNFYQVARKSAYETRYWLRLLEVFPHSESQRRELERECEELTKILTTIILNLKQDRVGTNSYSHVKTKCHI